MINNFFGFLYCMVGPFLFAFDGFSIGMLSLTSLIFFLCSFVFRSLFNSAFFLFAIVICNGFFFFLFCFLFWIYYFFMCFLNLFLFCCLWLLLFVGGRPTKVRASLELLYYTLFTSALFVCSFDFFVYASRFFWVFWVVRLLFLQTLRFSLYIFLCCLYFSR